MYPLRQCTSSLIMCRPYHFGFNEQTGTDNEFQHKTDKPSSLIASKALEEFDHAVQTLTSAGVEVLVLEHSTTRRLPDAVFPNNWFTTHPEGHIRLYSMKTANRQEEIDPYLLSQLVTAQGYRVNDIQSVTAKLHSTQILEGTGALVFDHINKIAYATLSERCEEHLFHQYCHFYGWTPYSFLARSRTQSPFYHTNVMMSVGESFAVVCGQSLQKTDKTALFTHLENNGKSIIDITLEQTEQSFCGNILEIRSQQGAPLIAMSQSAYNGFNATQKTQLETFGQILTCDIQTIEHIGGGSLRCMLAENFLPKL